ncbi:MAG TPA: ribosomal RNA small subunit methyltransferase A [Candidatus Atribacteria bacterium]|nr:ribosomal RNA small subunit methyltransferase A [Candidatus Atribacteria bacterium]
MEVVKLIKDFSVHPRKKMGQHFIVKNEVLTSIVSLGNFQKEDIVVEIGAGLGGLTTLLAERARIVLAIEKDGNLVNLLRTKIIKNKNVKIIHQDALNFDYYKAATEEGKLLKVVGNLPYNIASLLTIELLKKGEAISSMLLMYQKEVAERIIAQPGNKNYGFLTLMANLYSDSEEILSVGRESFYPRPKIESKLIKFNLLPSPREKLEDVIFFTFVIKTLFSQRRKKLRNSIKPLLGNTISGKIIENLFEDGGIDPNQRPETLTLKEFSFLCNQLFINLNPNFHQNH